MQIFKKIEKKGKNLQKIAKDPTKIQSKRCLLKGTQDVSHFFSFTSHLPQLVHLACAKPSQVQQETRRMNEIHIIRVFRDPRGPDMFKGREEV